MTATIPLHGVERELSGVIVGIDRDASGFIGEEFDKTNPKGMAFSLALEIADIDPKALIYLPTKMGDEVTSDESAATGVVPLVRRPQRRATSRVVLQHDVLELEGILDREDAVETALGALDRNAPVDDLWRDLRGREVSLSGVEANGMTIATSATVEPAETDEADAAGFQLVAEAEDALREEFMREGDEYWSYRTHLSAEPDSIRFLRFGVHGDHYESESHAEGRLSLGRQDSWTVGEVDERSVDKQAQMRERP